MNNFGKLSIRSQHWFGPPDRDWLCKEMGETLRHSVAARMVLACIIMLAASPCVVALDPSLDVDQYAHTAWKVREGFSRGGISSIAQSPDGYIWLGTEFGLLRFDGVKVVPWQPPAGEQLPSDYIRRLRVARDGRLWIGTSKGLASWKDDKLTQYPGLAGQHVSALLEDHEGTLWVGELSTSAHAGLCAIKNGSIRCEDKGGAFGNAVLGLFEDRKGNIWAATQTGLWRWKPGPPEFHPMQDELLGGFADGENGALLVTTVSGVKQIVEGKLSQTSRGREAEVVSPSRFDTAIFCIRDALRSRRRSMDRNLQPRPCACTPGKGRCVFAV